MKIIKEIRDWILAVVILVLVFGVPGFLLGVNVGRNAGARQMARHILNPKFKADSWMVDYGQFKTAADSWVAVIDGHIPCDNRTDCVYYCFYCSIDCLD